MAGFVASVLAREFGECFKPLNWPFLYSHSKESRFEECIKKWKRKNPQLQTLGSPKLLDSSNKSLPMETLEACFIYCFFLLVYVQTAFLLHSMIVIDNHISHNFLNAKTCIIYSIIIFPLVTELMTGMHRVALPGSPLPASSRSRVGWFQLSFNHTSG